ncbi:aconitate hydratase [Lysinibacillus sp. K60]|uniref:aconitate hydratase n=1 Tax=Lysinibacillus sp. K60 TaxID=2720027 RepID=UPI001C8BF48C|nr:aconitate hydratase [Lysinibacillus sp. K60]MBX8945970.1 aconitate hydratase [Lysinibacillus sp. K60]
MVNSSQREMLHKYLILDFAIRSLQRDYNSFENLKMKAVFLPLIDSLLKTLRQDYFHYKNKLKVQKIRVVCWYKIDEYFSDIQVATAGNDEIFRYANQAIKTEVENLIQLQLKELCQFVN